MVKKASASSSEQADSDVEIAARDALHDPAFTAKFGQKAINNEEALRKRLHEVKMNFYNRLESKKLIKKQGHIPFTEHMACSHADTIKIAEQLQANDDIKREIAL